MSLIGSSGPSEASAEYRPVDGMSRNISES